MGELDDTNSMIIQALAVVKKCGSSPEEHCIKEHVVELDEPSLSVKVALYLLCNILIILKSILS